MPTEASRRCHTCHGQGAVPAEMGPMNCPDCGGSGVLPGRDVLVEWRIAEIERVHSGSSDEVAPHLRWLAFELRRARQTLVKVMTLTEELDADQALVQRMRFLINETLGLYEPAEAEAPAASK